MSQTVIQIAEMTRIMELLFHVLDIRITFFDPEENEIPLGAIKPPCLFCRTRRLDSAFDARRSLVMQIIHQVRALDPTGRVELRLFMTKAEKWRRKRDVSYSPLSDRLCSNPRLKLWQVIICDYQPQKSQNCILFLFLLSSGQMEK